MSWITPKTDWTAADGVAFTDLNRMEGNSSFLLTAFRGKSDITISNYDNDSAPSVKTGSIFEANGIVIEVTGDAIPTGYSGISVSTTFYLYWDDSAEAFIYSETAPTWSDALQGWYNGDDRAFFSMYKDSGGTLYESKTLLISQNNLGLADMSIGVLQVGSNIMTQIERVLSGTTSTTYHKVREFVMPSSGIATFEFDLKSSLAGWNNSGRIYKNGVAVGTERTKSVTSYTTYSEDLSFSTGDKMQLYLKGSSSQYAIIRNFTIKTSRAYTGLLKGLLYSGLPVPYIYE